MSAKKLVKPNDKIVVAINSLVSTQQAAYSNHIQYFFRLGRNMLNYDFILMNPSRMSIDRMRNWAAQIALEQNAKYLLFIDDDVLVPHNTLQNLIDMDVDIAAGDVLIRGYPFNHMLFRWVGPKDNRQLTSMDKIPKGIFDVDAVGFSYCLIKTELLRKVPAPFFITGPRNTEDIYFCMKAKQCFPEVTIQANSDVKCGHILWSESITPMNREAYMKFYESQMSPEERAELGVKDESQMRGSGYTKRMKKIAGVE